MYQYNVNTALGDEIKKYRIGRGYTQDEFADICNISRAYYGRIERGEHSITIDTCQKIADVLNIRIADLFNNID